MDLGLRYIGVGEVKLQGYIYFDCKESVVDKKIIFRCCFILGSTMKSWYSRKKQSVALSSVEVEYMATNMESCEAVWLHKMLTGLFGMRWSQR